MEGIETQGCLIFGNSFLELVTVIANIPEAIVGMSVVRIQKEDPSHGALLFIPLLLHFVNVTKRKMRFRQALVYTQCFERCFLGFTEPNGVLVPASNDKVRIANGKAGVSKSIIWVQL